MSKGYKVDGSFAGKVFIKGNPAPKTAFKKGNVPWNKNKGQMFFCGTCKKKLRWGRKYCFEHSYTTERKEKFRQAKLRNPPRPMLGLRGKLSPNWKGKNAKTPRIRLLRESMEYEEWRKAIFMRDNYTCQFCGQIGGYLNADHIKPFAFYPKLRFELSNGRSLCLDCHKTTHTFFTKQKFNYGNRI